MIVEALLAQLDKPNYNGHIYTTKCMDDAIINNEAVQERLRNKAEFVIDGTKSYDAKNVIAYFDSGNYPVQGIIGRVLNYYIENNCLYAKVDIKDGIFTEKHSLYMAGIGTLTLDIDGAVMDDYEFGVVYGYKVGKESKKREEKEE